MVDIAAVPGALAQAREAARLANEDRLGEAVAGYQRLLAASPDLPDCWYELGRLQRRLGQFDAALESYAQALGRGITRPEEVYLNRGVIFADCLRREAAAERELRAALACNPAYLPALQNLANLHEDLGRREEALATYEHILTLDANAFEALARHGQLADIELPDDHLTARLRRALSHPAADAAAQASLGFALARRLDAAGEYRAAFAAALAAKRASRASAMPPVRYDRTGHERFVDALIAAFARPRTLAARADAVAHPKPIFVCGMYRSGSTLAERLLGAHPQVVAGGELDLLPHLVHSALTPFPSRIAATSDESLASLAVEYVGGLGQLFPGAQSVTDKRPDNFLLIGLIKTLFPDARIVHTTRDALDTCLSIFFLHLDPRVPWALELMDIGHYFRQYQRLMAHWRSLYGEDILDFSYDQLVRDPRLQAERLLGFCGLGWSESCLDFSRAGGAVKSASVWQVREPLYQRASGRARHYVHELGALRAYLADSRSQR